MVKKVNCNKDCEHCKNPVQISKNHWCYDKKYNLPGLGNTGEQKGGSKVKQIYHGIEYVHQVSKIMPMYFLPEVDWFL